MNKKALAVAVAGAMVPMAAQAVSFKVSGHVNRALRFLDDGAGSEVQHVDNAQSRTRVRFVGSEKFGNMEAGVFVEYGVASNDTAGPGGAMGSKFTTASDGGDDQSIRHSALWFSGAWGKVWLGHTFTADEDVMGAGGRNLEVNYTATNICRVVLRTAGGGNFGSNGCTAFASYDGGRTDLIKYESPKLGPFSLVVASEQNERWGVRGNLNTSLGGGKLDARLSYQDEDNSGGVTHVAGSVAFTFSQGTGIAAGYANRDFTAAGRNDAETWYLSLSHAWGTNMAKIIYQEYDETVANDTDGEKWGIAFEHNIPKPGINLYAAYENYDYDGAEDIDVFMLGARIAFR